MRGIERAALAWRRGPRLSEQHGTRSTRRSMCGREGSGQGGRCCAGKPVLRGAPTGAPGGAEDHECGLCARMSESQGRPDSRQPPSEACFYVSRMYHHHRGPRSTAHHTRTSRHGIIKRRRPRPACMQALACPSRKSAARRAGRGQAGRARALLAWPLAQGGRRHGPQHRPMRRAQQAAFATRHTRRARTHCGRPPNSSGPLFSSKPAAVPRQGTQPATKGKPQGGLLTRCPPKPLCCVLFSSPQR